MSLCPEAQFEDRVDRRQRDHDGEEGIQHQEEDLASLRMHIVLDDDLHAEPHVHRRRQHQKRDGDGILRPGKRAFDGVVVGARDLHEHDEQPADQN